MYTLNPFRLRRALRGLADAVAQTMPGSGWSDAVDEAVFEATKLVGPMDDDRALNAILARREDHAFEAYQQGCDITEAEYKEALEDKSAFIDEQAALIYAIMPHVRWGSLPDDLRNRLADYA